MASCFCVGLRALPVPRQQAQSPYRGFALLPTLALLLLLAAVTLALQSRSQTSLRLLSRLTTDLHDRAAQDALTDRLRGLVGDAMASPQPLPGRPASSCSPAPLRPADRAVWA
jgi:hypothetical protein